jgi:acetolactate synthase-1/2/3 large subunit
LKLSDYIAQFLAEKGIRHAFVVSGGSSLHLIHSVHDTPGIDFVCTQHEQASAMAADAYSRVTGNLGVAMATSGPGATNMITGVCCSYYDSVPVIYITGQVSTSRMKGDTGVRQIGFQETDTLDMYKPITKYSALVTDPVRIRYELEKAHHIATCGRPGPVLIDVPDNIQREDIDPDTMETFDTDACSECCGCATPVAEFVVQADIDRCMQLIRQAERPVIILGWGIRLAKAEKELDFFLDNIGIPVAPTWAVADYLPFDSPLLIGTFGTHGTRHANFAIQNADLVLSIGSRLDTKATGSPINTFARDAKKIVIDIDNNELCKFGKLGLEIDLLINADAKTFQAMNQQDLVKRDNSEWLKQIKTWKKRFPVCPDTYYEDNNVNPYVFVKELSKECRESDTILLDTGCTLPWMMQAFEFKSGQRLFHDWNNTAMGWGVPAAIAASLAHPARRVICITGDGSLQMNIQELATVLHHRLPIKIFLINNHGYSMIQQTQDQWFDSNYLASSVEGGLAFPDFIKVAEAYGFQTSSIDKNQEISARLEEALSSDGSFFCNIEIPQNYRVTPQVKFGRPNEDATPLLDRDVFLENMIIDPLEVLLS